MIAEIYLCIKAILVLPPPHVDLINLIPLILRYVWHYCKETRALHASEKNWWMNGGEREEGDSKKKVSEYPQHTHSITTAARMSHC